MNRVTAGALLLHTGIAWLLPFAMRAETTFARLEAKFVALVSTNKDTQKDVDEYLDGCRKAFGPHSEKFALRASNLGSLFYSFDRPEKALPLYLLAQDEFTSLKGANSFPAANAKVNTASAYWKLGDIPTALRLTTEALQVIQSLPKEYRPYLVQTLNNLGRGKADLGDFAAGESDFKEAFRILEEDSRLEGPLAALCYENLGYLQSLKGDRDSAETSLLKAWSLFMSHADPAQYRVLGTLSALYLSGNEVAQAKVYAKIAVDGMRSQASPADLASQLDNYGVILWRNGEVTEAESVLRESLGIRKSSDRNLQSDIALGLLNLASLLDGVGRIKEVPALLSEAETILAGLPEGNDWLRAGVKHDLAVAARKAGDYAEGLRLVDQSLSLSQRYPERDRLKLMASLRLKAYLLVDSARPTKAIAAVQAYTRALKSELENAIIQGDEQRKLALLQSEEFQRPFDLWENLDEPRKMADCVLQFKELTLELLIERSRRLATPESQSVRALEAKSKILRERLTRLPEASRARLLDSLADTNKALGELRSKEKLFDSELAAVRGAFATTADRVSKRLPLNSALLEFVRFEKNQHGRAEPSYGCSIILSGGGVFWKTFSADAVTIDRLVDRFVAAAAKGTSEDELLATLTQLYEILWPKISEVLPPATQTIITSADGSLHKLAFPCLIDGKAMAERRLPFLADKFDFITAVASGRDLLQEYMPPSGKKAVLIADPAFDSDPEHWSGEEKMIETPMPAAVRRQLYSQRFPRLSQARKECDAVKKALMELGWSGITELRDQAASEANMRRNASADLIHIATHGVFLTDDSTVIDHRSALQPADERFQSDRFMNETMLILAGYDRVKAAWLSGTAVESANDGVLTAAEVSNFPLWRPWLVTLSACDIGRGTVVPGEGVLGMQRALGGNGARNVLVTLWNVKSAYTSEFMQDFYRKALESGDPPRALAQVQQSKLDELYRRSLFDAVRFAGPFTLVFRGQLKPKSENEISPRR